MNVLHSAHAEIWSDARVKGFVETQYARSGDAHIAYQTVGDANLDLVLLPGAFSHVEHQWEEPSFARFLISPCHTLPWAMVRHKSVKKLVG